MLLEVEALLQLEVALFRVPWQQGQLEQPMGLFLLLLGLEEQMALEVLEALPLNLALEVGEEVLLALEVLPLNLLLEVQEEQMGLEALALNLALMEVVALMEVLQSLNWSLTEMLQMRLLAAFPSS